MALFSTVINTSKELGIGIINELKIVVTYLSENELVIDFFTNFEWITVLMSRLLFVFVFSIITLSVKAQVCTISSTGTWSTRTCVETGLAPVSGNTIVVPFGITVTIGAPAPTPIHTGSLIIFGTVINDKANARWDGNVTIEGTGRLELNQKFDIGPNTPGCGYTLTVKSGGKLVLSGSGGSDLLSICGAKIAQSGGACNSCGGTNSGNCAYNGQPYCEPAGGFTGPLTYTEGGALPVTLIFFNGKFSGNNVLLEWATADEEDFDRFVVQHAINGIDFSDVSNVPGAGYNTESRNDYSFTHTLPIIGYNYYRLKAVDLNGSYEYFGPIALRFAGHRSLWVHPNPTSSDRVDYQSNFTSGEGDRIQVYNQVGLLVADVPAKGNSGTVYFAEPLRAGAYILRYSSANDARFARFVVLR